MNVTLTFEDEKKVWMRILDFFRNNPQILYKGIPLALVAYVSLPLMASLWTWLPWIWAGYEVYHRIQPGSATTLWDAIQKYKSR